MDLLTHIKQFLSISWDLAQIWYGKKWSHYVFWGVPVCLEDFVEASGQTKRTGNIQLVLKKWYYLAIQARAELIILLMVFNSLWSSDVIWRYRLRSTLAQVIDCCLEESSQYLKHCWLFIGEVLWHTTRSNFTSNSQATILYNVLENYISKDCHISQGAMYRCRFPNVSLNTG